MRLKRHLQEHNTMSLARARTQTARSGVECTNHEATAPPFIYRLLQINFLRMDTFFKLHFLISFSSLHRIPS